jgi:hypothetical protein
MSRALRSLLLTVLPLVLALGLLLPPRAWAGPVSWVEVPPTAEGRQWWDEGSLRRNRAGHLTVLSRFQAAPQPDATVPSRGGGEQVPAAVPTVATPSGSESALPKVGAESLLPASTQAPAGSLPPDLDQRSAAARSAPPISRLYVMELDCDQGLYRDISINGLPQFGASWQPTGSDDLTAEVLRQACAAEVA